MVLARRKIKGSTLVEVLVAMTIISLVAGLSMVIFFQVSGPSSSIRSLVFAQQKTSEIMDTVSQKWMMTHPEKWIEFQEFDIKLTTRWVESNLNELSIEAVDNHERIIYQRSRIFYVYEGKR